MILELPLVIINVQRGGPSTGLPTKTEQADLLQAVYGRNGEAPIPVLAASSPSDCFTMTYEACRLAVEHMTPVFLLSDGYIANGAEPWMYPKASNLSDIRYQFEEENLEIKKPFLPYKRDDKLVRSWALPGNKGTEHRVGGLEKDKVTGNVSYDPDNHEYMVKIRAEKIDRIADYIPLQELDSGSKDSQVLVLGWGSTYGAIKTAVRSLREEGIDIAHAHLKYILPMPKNLGDILSRYKKILIPEMNNGQLIKLIRDKYLVDAKPFNKIKGAPFESREIKNKIQNMLIDLQ
jgi:2-oxoglutarate ferredoxin oxidoreductase subunit alpha